MLRIVINASYYLNSNIYALIRVIEYLNGVLKNSVSVNFAKRQYTKLHF